MTYYSVRTAPDCTRQQGTPENGQQEVLIKINGEVTFTWTGYDNVHQADENWIPFFGDAVETSIHSGDAQRGGTFTNVFDEPGCRVAAPWCRGRAAQGREQPGGRQRIGNAYPHDAGRLLAARRSVCSTGEPTRPW
jgi:hypothetical protein